MNAMLVVSAQVSMRMQIRIQHFRSIRIRIQGFDDQKKLENFTAEKIFFFIAISLSLGLQKGRPSYRRGLQTPKENIRHFKS
jgi:hypothetical protein